jgi:hypothetical protein
VLRRFESYGFAPHATADAQRELARVLRTAGAHIPEVLDSAVGRNRSEVAVDLVWEHAYERPDAYGRYMCHPFHICVLDRYLLPENPECITASRQELQLGLFGYEVDGAPFRATTGIRRVVAMKVADGVASAEVEGFLARLNARADAIDGVDVSVAAPNTMGLEWFRDAWTHVWEQAFPDEAAMRASIADETALLESGPMRDWIDLWYAIEADDGSVSNGSLIGPDPVDGPLLMVDAVTVADADAERYLAAFERLYLPGARRRGMELVACWQTPAGLGEDVTVTTVCSVGRWADWERMRNAAVGDPAMGEWIAARRAVMRAGRRSFVTGRVGPPPPGG